MFDVFESRSDDKLKIVFQISMKILFAIVINIIIIIFPKIYSAYILLLSN